ncbi:MAG: RimK-like protein [Planctomycetes bacterium]|nr:RimK-like protein [Planctomycetota bacterium]
MTILILGSDVDEHATWMLAHLAQRGADVELFDSRWFPGDMQIAFDPVARTGLLRLPSGRQLDWGQIHSVYWRNYNGLAATALPDAEQAEIAHNDTRSMFETLLLELDSRWVNSFHAFRLHQTKPVQLARVAALGIPVPATCLGNDAESIRSFVALHGECIFKPVQGGAHTQKVTPDLLGDEALSRLAMAPVTIQEKITGDDIRVFVAGDRVLACQIETDALDFRDDPRAKITTCSLPPDVHKQALAIANTLELLWTGIDFRRTPEGRYVFFEANPSPMFIGFEQRTGLPLTESLATLLLC